MEFQSPHYKDYTEDFHRIAQQYSLNPDNLKVEFYTPDCQAILVEKVQNDLFKIHINLEEHRIISIQRLSLNGNGNGDRLKEKYRRFMK